MTMPAIKSFVARHWLGAVGFLVGYAIGGIFVAALILTTTEAFQFVVARRTSIAAATSTEATQHPAEERKSAKLLWLQGKYAPVAPLSVRVFLAWIVGALVPALCSIILMAIYESRAVAAWSQTWQPTVDWLGAYIPALERTPGDLSAIGYLKWAPAQQLVLFVGWILTLPLMLWMALDVLYIHRYFWIETASGSSRKELAQQAFICIVFLAGALLILFVGIAPSSWREAFVGLGLLGLGFMFFSIAVCFLWLLVTFNRLIYVHFDNYWKQSRDDARQTQNKLTGAWRRTLRNK